MKKFTSADQRRDLLGRSRVPAASANGKTLALAGEPNRGGIVVGPFVKQPPSWQLILSSCSSIGGAGVRNTTRATARREGYLANCTAPGNAGADATELTSTTRRAPT